MSTNSKIEWTTHTFNGWRGCAKVSRGCLNCYAETRAKRFGAVQGEWGASAMRVVAAEDSWRKPERWNQASRPAICETCQKEWFVASPANPVLTELERNRHSRCPAPCDGALIVQRPRVFCASLADVFEDYQGGNVVDHRLQPLGNSLDPVRGRLFDLIHTTPHLDWLLLTKRPHHIRTAIERALEYCTDDTANALLKPWLEGTPPQHVWLGTSAEDQSNWCERIPMLMSFPAHKHFVSVEPLLGPIMLDMGVDLSQARPDWVIVGGESGPGARTMEDSWVRDIRDDCQNFDIDFFFKQWGGTNKKQTGRQLDGQTYDAIPA